MSIDRIGILGATTFTGDYLLDLCAMLDDVAIYAFSRKEVKSDCHQVPNLTWCQLTPELVQSGGAQKIAYWICLAPLGVIPAYFGMMEKSGAKKVVVLSSTSRYTKADSKDSREQQFANRLVQLEDNFQQWAAIKKIQWVILRPTMIYSYGRDNNVSAIARFIKRYRFYPVFGKALGKRQPIHASDVAKAAYQALISDDAVNRGYNISGAEVISYRDMVKKIARSTGGSPLVIRFPRLLFAMVIWTLRVFPRFRKYSIGMADRMNRDMSFDHSDATRDFGFKPGPFTPLHQAFLNRKPVENTY